MPALSLSFDLIVNFMFVITKSKTNFVGEYVQILSEPSAPGREIIYRHLG